MIIGESRSGKTVAASLWREENNHGTSVMVTAPPYGGAKTFLRRIAEAVGVSKNQPAAQTVEAIGRAFNRNRILIIDEAHRLMPCDRRTNPTNLEILRDLHDATKCGLALIATQRLDEELRKSLYMYEQLLGRIGMPIRLPGTIKKLDWMPILKQYVKNPGERLINECNLIANSLGRLGILVETLKVASRIASKSKENLNEEHVFKAIALRKQMMGDAAHYAYKH
jgi:DNA transposition AAA+ family ATPase